MASRSTKLEGTARQTAKRETSADASRILLFLISLRLANAFLIRTFFQPDEYFQSLEPAWQIAFGPYSGAHITWEWKQQLRSSLHPYLFAGAYRAAASLANVLGLGSHGRAELLLAAPKVLQALIAALMDYYTWRVAVRTQVGGQGGVSRATLFLCIFSPWQWFCSTRTLMNPLESMLTVAALAYWPWELFVGKPSNTAVAPITAGRSRWSLRKALCLAALAVILRVPNIIIWVVVSGACAISALVYDIDSALWIIVTLFGEAVLCGSTIFGLSLLADKRYYGIYTIPPLRFLHFNVVQSLAVFYGNNRVDYYVTEGLPLLLTSALPFAVAGVTKVISGSQDISRSPPSEAHRVALLYRVASVSAIGLTIGALTLIPHKEVRFLYPLLPMLTTLGAQPLATFFRPFPRPNRPWKRLLLYSICLFNVCFAAYITLAHQRGVMDVTQYLRDQHEQRVASRSPSLQELEPRNGTAPTTSVGFLMPCHSTPWRSHLLHRGIKGWALTCEPPINMTATERATYLDEADQFYADPRGWLDENMAVLTTTMTATDNEGRVAEDRGNGGRRGSEAETSKSARPWPEFVVFFEQLEPLISDYMAGSGYERCWKGFNSHFHDDWRRRGDVIVWCRRQG